MKLQRSFTITLIILIKIFRINRHIEKYFFKLIKLDMQKSLFDTLK